jgi:hypothetical protein
VYGISERCSLASHQRPSWWLAVHLRARLAANYHTRVFSSPSLFVMADLCPEGGAEFDYCLVIAGETIDNRSAVHGHKILVSFVARVASFDLIVSPSTTFQRAAPVNETVEPSLFFS